jgi:hypothetical protein
MSTIARFEPEAAEVSRTCQILILCEDAAAYERAADICWRILVQLADDLDFSFNCWSFIELNDPDCARSVLTTASVSDVILLALRSTNLPPVAAEWLEALAQNRLRAEGALALVLNEPPDSPAAVAKLVARLEQAARQMGMDFLSLVQTSEEAVSAWPGRRGYEHWGLNE